MHPDAVTADRSRPVRRRLLWVLAVVVLLVLLVAAWLAWRGWQVVTAMREAEPVLRSVQDDLRGGDLAAVQEDLPVLADAAGRARTATQDPVWRAAGHVPWLGRQTTAVADAVQAVHLVSTEVVPRLAEVGAAVDPARMVPVDGRIDLAPIEAAGPPLRAASAAATTAEELVDGIATEGLVDPLARQVESARTTLGEAAGTLRAVSTAADLLPPMLGADGPRQYLLLMMNSGEPRSLGGIVGAVTVVSVDDGAVALTDHRPAEGVVRDEDVTARLTAEEVEVHTDRLGRYIQNTTLTPDFPRGAELASALWQQTTGTEVDGVLALDVVALSYVLDATGPVVDGTGETLEASTVVQALLLDAYSRFPDPDDTDEYFSGAAAAIFAALAGGQGDVGDLLPALLQATSERRLSLWSRHAEEQSVLEDALLGGAFLSGAADGAAGVFLDDTTATKVGYFLRSDVGVEDLVCAPGASSATVTVDLRSEVPADVASLPLYMTTTHPGDTPSGVNRNNVTVYAPVGGGIGEVRQDGGVVGGRRATEAGREVVVLTSTLAPGEASRYEVDLLLPEGTQRLPAWTTPTTTSPGRVPAATCG